MYIAGVEFLITNRANNLSNEEYFQKLEILQTYQTDIIEAETFEEITKHVFDAIDATIDPVIKIIGQVHSGAIRGFYQIRGEEIGVVRGEADGILLDGPGIMVRAVNSKKTSNVPDTREDPDYLEPGENFSTLSEIAAPILFQGKSIGVINIEETRVNAFDLSDQQVLETLSRYAGVSLSRVLYSFKLNSLHKHTSQLSVSTSIEEVAKQTLEAMTDTLDFESCVFILNQVGALQTVYEKGLEESIRLREKAVNYFRIIGSEHSRGADDIEFLSELEAPVNIENEVVAILSAKIIQPDKYAEQDKQLLETLASHVASAIQRIRLLEEQIQYEAKLEALHLHTTKLADAENIEEISEYTIEAMETTLGFTWAVFSIVENNFVSGMIWLRSGVRTYGDKNPTHIEGPGIGSRAARTGETQLVNDVRNDVDYIGPFMDESTLSKLEENFQKGLLRARELNPEWGSLSEIDVPVKIDDTVVAILNAENIELNAFSEQDQNLLEILASHVASAIQRIRMLEERAQYEAKLESLHTSALKLVNTETLEDICRFIRARAISDILDYEWVGLGFVYDNIIRYFYDTKDEQTPEKIQREYIINLNDNTIITRAAKTGEIQDIPNTELDPDFICTVFNDEGEPLIKSEYTIPIIQFGKVVAVLNAESTRLNAFSEQYKKLLEILASHVSSAIQRIRLLEEQQKYEAKLEALHVHTSNLADAESIKEIAEYTINAMSTTLGYRWGLFLLLKDDHLVSLGMLGEYIERGYAAPNIPLDRAGITTRAAKIGKTQLVNDTRLDPDFFSSDNTLSELDVPIKIEDKVIGVLNVESLELNAFSEQDQELLEILASHVASAIQRIKLLEEQQKYEAKLEALHLHTTKLADAENMEEISEHTIEAMETTLGFSFAVFYVVEDEIWRGMVASRSGVRTYGDKHPGHIDGPGIGARAIRTGETQLVNDVRKDVDYVGPFMNENTFSKLEETHQKDMLDALTLDPSARTWVSLSELDVPVKIDQTVFALLNAESNELNAFTEQDMYLLETLASHVASAVQGIRFQEEQRQYEALLEARTKKLETVNKDLENEIQTRKEYEQEIVRVARESEVDRLRSQFLSTITHELRTPLTSIKGYLEVIRSGWVGDVSPEMNESLEVIIRNTDRLSTLTSDLLDIQRISSGRLEVDLKTIDLKKVIEQSVKEIGPVLSEKKQILDLEIPEESLEIIGDSQRLNQVLMNLLNNASKFSNEETTIHLGVKTDDEKILVSVRDSGIGILESDLDRVFTPLAMIEKPIYVKGTGLGLSISKGLIDLHNGRIWAESEGEWKGSTFTIQLPKGG